VILIGTYERVVTRGGGHFWCPQCGSRQPCRERSSQYYLTFYFVPTVPLGRGVPFLECRSCRGTFPLEANQLLATVPEGEPPSQERRFADQLAWLLACLLCDQAGVEPQGIAEALDEYELWVGQPLLREELGARCGQVQQMRLSPQNALRYFSADWTAGQRRRAVQLIFRVASSSGDPRPGHLQALIDAERILGLSRPQYQRAIDEAVGGSV
jgi:hypothetical protein